MLKRMWNAISSSKGAAESAPPSPSPTNTQPAIITVFDAHGRELKITLEQWRENVLQPNLKQHWNNPNELYNLITSALQDKLAADVLDAARQLAKIDTQTERGHTIHGITALGSQLLDEAEAAFREGMRKAGETGSLQANMAKITWERGRHAEAEAQLWRAIETDPNLDNGLMWWLAIQKEREGDAAYSLALKKVAQLPGSWRAQLWLARVLLDAGEADQACDLYRKVLAGESYDGNTLMMISGDLGNRGQVNLIPEIVAPVYDPTRHAVPAGLNLLQAYQTLGRWQDGEALLEQLYKLKQPAFKQHLDRYAQVFQQMHVAASNATNVDPEALEVQVISLDRPIWAYSLRSPTWLLREKADSAESVLFFPFARRLAGEQQAVEQREDDSGRLSRSIPLYLAEAVHYWTPSAGHGYFSVVKGGGPAVFGEEPEMDKIYDQLSDGVAYVVTGTITLAGEKSTLSIRLWDRRQRSCIRNILIDTKLEELARATLEAERQLLEALGGQLPQPFDAFYIRPTEEMIQPYLVSLAQSFTLMLAANDLSPKSGLWGERAMLEWPLRMALHWPAPDQFNIMYISGLAKGLDYRSDVLEEFKERTLQHMRALTDKHRPSSALAPLISKVFGDDMTGKAQAFPVAEDKAQQYLDWIARIEEERK